MCRLHLPSYRSTPSVVQSISLSCFGLRRKGVTQFPHLVELRCRRICMKTNYVLSEENEKVAKCCSLMLWQKRWILFSLDIDFAAGRSFTESGKGQVVNENCSVVLFLYSVKIAALTCYCSESARAAQSMWSNSHFLFWVSFVMLMRFKWLLKLVHLNPCSLKPIHIFTLKKCAVCLFNTSIHSFILYCFILLRAARLLKPIPVVSGWGPPGHLPSSSHINTDTPQFTQHSHLWSI